MLTCSDVARYFLSKVDDDAGDAISNLKLQKLVYYAQGFHLAICNDLLFPESIMAWEHGPVIPELYHTYKIYTSAGIPPVRDLDFSIYDEEVKSLLDEVYEVYGQFSAWKLRNMTHDETPWKEAYNRCPSSEIDTESMKTYFNTLIK